jgi:hypothetical protein
MHSFPDWLDVRGWPASPGAPAKPYRNPRQYFHHPRKNRPHGVGPQFLRRRGSHGIHTCAGTCRRCAILRPGPVGRPMITAGTPRSPDDHLKPWLTRRPCRCLMPRSRTRPRSRSLQPGSLRAPSASMIGSLWGRFSQMLSPIPVPAICSSLTIESLDYRSSESMPQA